MSTDADLPALPAPTAWMRTYSDGSRALRWMPLAAPDDKDTPLFTADQLRAALASQAEKHAAFKAQLLECIEEPDDELLTVFQEAFVRQLKRRKHKPGLESAEKAGVRAMLKHAIAREVGPSTAQAELAKLRQGEPAQPRSVEREAVERMVTTVRDWLGSGCIGEPPRIHVAGLCTIVDAVLSMPPREALQPLSDEDIVRTWEMRTRWHAGPPGVTDTEFARDIERLITERMSAAKETK